MQSCAFSRMSRFTNVEVIFLLNPLPGALILLSYPALGFKPICGQGGF